MQTNVEPSLPDPVAQLIKLASTLVPGAVAVAEPGGVKAGNWWVEIKGGLRSATVEWRPDRGFGVYGANAETYGEGPREVFRDSQMAARRLCQLLTEPKAGRSWLKMLRELHGVSQMEVAGRLGIGQGNISKLEKRSKVQLHTVVNLVTALGGSLEIRARFPEGEFPLEVGAFSRSHPPSPPRQKSRAVRVRGEGHTRPAGEAE